MSGGRFAIIALIIPCLLVLPRLGVELRDLGGDIHLITARATYSDSWRALGAGDFHDFMVFTQRHVPPSAAVISIAVQPAFGYYRGAYELYPRTVWPIVSPLGPHAHDRPHLTARLVDSVIAQTRARYLVVWRMPLPRPLPAYRWEATYAPNEYVMALR